MMRSRTKWALMAQIIGWPLLLVVLLALAQEPAPVAEYEVKWSITAPELPEGATPLSYEVQVFKIPLDMIETFEYPINPMLFEAGAVNHISTPIAASYAETVRVRITYQLEAGAEVVGPWSRISDIWKQTNISRE